VPSWGKKDAKDNQNPGAAQQEESNIASMFELTLQANRTLEVPGWGAREPYMRAPPGNVGDFTREKKRSPDR